MHQSCLEEGKAESWLARGMIELFCEIGMPPQIVYTDDAAGISNSGLFEKYVRDHEITVHVATANTNFHSFHFQMVFKPNDYSVIISF